mmetsp:Transcript_39872/g.43206  ORF Transcript_39872/g.43206 Transcript_39872/m.43206 type:complete len:106 (+) Transcript_39872:20-337(+)
MMVMLYVSDAVGDAIGDSVGDAVGDSVDDADCDTVRVAYIKALELQFQFPSQCRLFTSGITSSVIHCCRSTLLIIVTLFIVIYPYHRPYHLCPLKTQQRLILIQY